jgi:hypothetical protein
LLIWLAAVNPSRAAELDPSALIRGLERPVPASIAFKEVRFSALLEQPLVVSGELKYVAATHLERLVTNPYRERTVIRGESVRVERHGEKLRTFALNRAPELKGMLMAFSGLLAGEPDSVRRHFEVSTGGTSERWSLRLTPLDPRAQKQLAELRMIGHDNEPSCFFMTSTGGGRSVMLLGALADAPIDSATTVDSLNALCSFEPAR